MKKFATLLLLFYCFTAKCSNWVTVPDSLFRVYITSIAPGAIVGDSMNITNTGVLSATTINITGLGISSIEGVEYFTSLVSLQAAHNNIITLPALSATLTYLNVDSNKLMALGVLPANLKTLYCNTNQLVEIDSLPTHLQTADCHNNKLLCVPVLPDSLVTFKAAGNFISCLPNVPVLGTFTSDVASNGLGHYYVCDTNTCNRYTNISGYAFLDLNHNGVRDAGEPGLSNVIITIQPLGETAETDSAGHYIINGHPGITETITPAHISRAALNPDSVVVQLASPQADSANVNFAYVFAANDSFSDVRVLANEVIPAVAGQVSSYELVASNHGAVAERGQLRFIFSPMFTYNASTPAATVSGDTLIWNFTGLYPGSDFYYHVNLNVKSTDVAGAPFTQTTVVAVYNRDSVPVLTFDSVPANDTLVLNDTIVRTYPVNNKTVTPATYTGANFNAGDYFNYTITFQNTDTSTATHVWIIDSLNNYFDMNTLYVVSASASYRLTINGHVLRVDFDNINLPDTAQSNLLSHGFFTFNIRPLSANFVGTIHNTAYIYFDGKTLSPPVGTGLQVCLSNLQISVGSNPETISYCGTNTLGNANVIAANGSTPYTYLWNTGSHTNSIAGLVFGEYYVSVTDQCQRLAVGMVFVDSLMAGGCNTWMGLSPDWSSGSNWSNGSAPNGCGDNAYVPAGRRYYPSLTGNSSVGNLKVYPGAGIDLGGYSLSVCGNFTAVAGGTIPIAGSGQLVFNGSSAQGISGYISCGQVVIDNTGGGVTVTGHMLVSNGLILHQGNISNSGNVILLSNASGDSYLDNFSAGNSGNFNGGLTMQRYVGNSSDGYRDLSSPVQTNVSQLAAAFSVFGQNGVHCWYNYNPYPNVQIYDETLDSMSAPDGNYYTGWISYTAGGNLLSPMLGVAARTYVGGPYTINFSGVPHDGGQSIALTYTPSSTPAADGWNFVGNPYPSAISWSAVASMNGGATDGSYYVFHTTGEYSGNWGSNNGFTGVNGAANEIASSQGFFVRTSGNGSLFMDNSVRTATAATFYGPRRSLNNEVRLTLTGANNSDEIVTYTDSAATYGYDPSLDALKMPAGGTVYMSFASQGKEYAINVIDSVTVNTELALNLQANDTGAYILAATSLNTPELTAYLKDAQTGNLINLATGNASLTLNAGQFYTNRYSVIFKANQVVTTGISATSNLQTRIYSSDNTAYVQRADNEPATIQIFNILGQKIVEVESNTQFTALPLQGPEVWYALVKVTEGKNVSVAKVLITITNSIW